MPDQIILWLSHADAALLGQGPVVTVLLCLGAGYAAAQFWKFPVRYYFTGKLPDGMVAWSIRLAAMVTSFALGLWLGGLPPAFIAIIALLQPQFYQLVMKLIRHFLPWMAATPVGSATPTPDDETALTVWRDKPKP